MADESMPNVRIDRITTNCGERNPKFLLQVQTMDGRRQYYIYAAIIIVTLTGLALFNVYHFVRWLFFGYQWIFWPWI